MKLLNYKCVKCGREYEELLSTYEEIELGDQLIICPVCDNEMKPFNFKNNSQTWKYNDTRS